VTQFCVEEAVFFVLEHEQSIGRIAEMGAAESAPAAANRELEAAVARARAFARGEEVR
jgi:hypothetical protein